MEYKYYSAKFMYAFYMHHMLFDVRSYFGQVIVCISKMEYLW